MATVKDTPEPGIVKHSRRAARGADEARRAMCSDGR
jgi:hypothetical protein